MDNKQRKIIELLEKEGFNFEIKEDSLLACQCPGVVVLCPGAVVLTTEIGENDGEIKEVPAIKEQE